MDDWIQIITIEEVLYHLATKEIICFNLLDEGFGYFEQKGNDFYICIQPKHGSSTLAKGNRGMLRKIFKSFHDTEFYVMPGLNVGVSKLTLFDKVADYFNPKTRIN